MKQHEDEEEIEKEKKFGCKFGKEGKSLGSK
jgi:hypothetical protein